jgi:diguanylate cyclase (GGDEF)-like protein
MMALLMLDLDNFKPVNDTHGHPAGDALLRDVGMRLKSLCRETDTVARIGGDEFAFVLVSLKNEEDIIGIAQKIVETLAQPVTIMGHEVKIDGSVGAALVPDGSDDIEDLIRKADEALYEAKRAGRNTFRIHHAAAAAG